MSPRGRVIRAGRRKEAVARAQLRPGTGEFTINGKPLAEYFPTAASQMVVTEPLLVTGMHLHYPGFGHVAREGDAYRFVPEAGRQQL